MYVVASCPRCASRPCSAVDRIVDAAVAIEVDTVGQSVIHHMFDVDRIICHRRARFLSLTVPHQRWLMGHLDRDATVYTRHPTHFRRVHRCSLCSFLRSRDSASTSTVDETRQGDVFPFWFETITCQQIKVRGATIRVCSKLNMTPVASCPPPPPPRALGSA